MFFVSLILMVGVFQDIVEVRRGQYCLYSEWVLGQFGLYIKILCGKNIYFLKEKVEEVLYKYFGLFRDIVILFIESV